MTWAQRLKRVFAIEIEKCESIQDNFSDINRCCWWELARPDRERIASSGLDPVPRPSLKAYIAEIFLNSADTRRIFLKQILGNRQENVVNSSYPVRRAKVHFLSE